MCSSGFEMNALRVADNLESPAGATGDGVDGLASATVVDSVLSLF
jgi:hypothetical protein